MIRAKHLRSGTHLGPPLVRCRDYLQFIRGKACLLCDRDGVDAHHYGPHGLGKKAPDWLAVPLCADCHRMVHEQKAELAERYDLTPGELDTFVAICQRDLLVEWLMQQEGVPLTEDVF